jgi:hypothetical protein
MLSVRPAQYYMINISGIINIRAANLNGRNSFHAKYIRLSYRIRGKVARIQINRVAKTIVLITSERFSITIFLEKTTTVIILIIRIFMYSAIKISANDPALYSTLNPDTNSDSPSAKSNGVRLVSARLVTNHIKHKGIAINIVHEYKDMLIE